ncbi:hypothetical protein O4J56_06895 [Nocardiopsis sp. RSe5-2]|uniref:WXG100 family type VII secretion target n=1 Tax=Nocardiopsis endophytica TaxID=3018445 RepID=A0ABT4U090_9ACTN|nr:hypothetical protein [Nocardiopsis endophytica]MDA2810362.1 hypothetical protein [Nocardiopsis endophytica]
MRKRVWAMQARAWGYRAKSWLARLWERWTGRVSDDARYGNVRGAQLALAAAAVAGFGARPRRSEPRVLTGRVIGTNAPSPQDGPIAAIGRGLMAITVGTPTEEESVAAPVQRVRDAAEELKSALSDFGGMGMLDYERGLKELPELFEQLAQGLDNMANRAEDEEPVDASVLNFFSVISQASRGASGVASEMPGLFRAAHETELERLENPRPNEEKWDVTQQD